jgi:hypothetical protein
MPHTYKAILKGDRVQWLGDAPDTNGGVSVQITVVENPPKGNDLVDDAAARGAAMAAALQKIADSGGIPAIPDPVAWQREIRKDRPLPGRDGQALE